MRFVSLSVYLWIRPSALLGAAIVAAAAAAADDDEAATYGVDVSFPIHHPVSQNYPWLPHNVDPAAQGVVASPLLRGSPLQPLGDRHSRYVEYLRGCRENSEVPSECDQFEYHRMLMNLRQPQSVRNYTDTGFRKIRAPDRVVRLIQEFWRKNHFKGREENWGDGNSYLNWWESPTYMVSVDDTALRGSGLQLKENIWAAATATLEEWTQQELQPVSMYGIRVYGEGAVMLPHVDRLPLVCSAIINVFQDLDEPWPTEVYDHFGVAHNVTLNPGEMLLFESHSVIHGHPFPLVGRSYASMFIHFEPTGHSLLRNTSGLFKSAKSVDQRYREAVQDGIGGQSASAEARDLPPYLIASSPEEEIWREAHPEGWKPPYDAVPPEAHAMAVSGQLEELERRLNEDPQALTLRDEQGWQVLHQGVAGGSKDVVELLVEHGADVNARTHGGYGESPLRIAEKRLGTLHPVVEYLKSLGALSIGPEL